MINPLANIVGTLEVGDNCRVDPYVTITGHVKLGDNVHIGVGASIFGSAGVEIGNDCSVSPGAQIFTTSFDRRTRHKANPQLKDKDYFSAPVKIGDRCIVGAGSVVLPGTVLANDVQVGALSLVKGELAPGLYAGCPVRQI